MFLKPPILSPSKKAGMLWEITQNVIKMYMLRKKIQSNSQLPWLE